LKTKTVFLKFFVVEVIGKTLLFCFIATFFVHLLLFATPKVESLRISVRGGESYKGNNNEHNVAGNTAKGITGYRNHNFLSSYMAWITGVFQWELGTNKGGQKITEEIKEKLPITFTLSFASFLPAIIVSFFIGLRKDKGLITITKNVIFILTALPAFFLGYLLIALFGYHISLFPRYIMAILTLGLSSGIICEMSRVIDEAMETELSKEYIETATAKGLVNSPFPWIGTVRFHAFRNALITILPQVSLIFTFVISGSLVVEQVFDLPGVSFMLLKGLGDKDIARVLVIILIGVLLIRIGSILSNFVYLLLNPKYGENM